MHRESVTLFIVLLFFSCESSNPEHYAQKYNQEVDKAMLKTYFPHQYNFSFSIRGNTTLLNASCPQVSREDKYVNIDYTLSENIDPKEVAVMNIFVEKKQETEWVAVLDRYYLPDGYENHIKFRNPFPQGEYRLWYGFFLKKDSLDKYPRLHKTSCGFKVK